MSDTENACGESERFLPLVYDELRFLAAQQLAHERPGQTLQPTALVHEAYLRLTAGDAKQHWNHRGHFFAAAAQAMRRILIEHARRKNRQRHGGGLRRVDWDSLQLGNITASDEILALDAAIQALSEKDAEAAQVVHLRFFGGLTMEETAETLGISLRTAHRDWAFARAWLYDQLRTEES